MTGAPIALQTMTQTQAARALQAAALAVLPLGAVEAHGDHLPLGTDNVLAERLAHRYVAALPVPAVLLPVLPFGPMWSTERFPGSLPIGRATLVHILLDLARGLARQGVRVLAVVNGHYGNREAMTEASRTLHDEGLFLLGFTYPGGDAEAARVRETKVARAGYMHACEIETSFMLALAPEHVALDAAVANYPAFPDSFDVLPERWDAFSPSSVLGDPRAATADKGEAILAVVLARMVALTEAALARIG
jgi:creatinine amidohydrolase